MGKMWAGRFSKEADKIADEFNSSIGVDCRMYRQDIEGSLAHAAMLGAQGIIPQADSEKIIDGLTGILEDLESGKLKIDKNCEDIHMFVETVLTKRIGDAGRKLHTARSRNDQVALDERLYLRESAEHIIERIKSLITVITDKAEEQKATVMPGYTHLQRAQPVTFGHYLMAYSMMLLRDAERFEQAKKRMNVSPIGCCALAGTTYNTDRRFEAEKLGFDGITQNSLDGVSDRDYCLDMLYSAATCIMHLSRLAEEIILWSSWEFSFVELDDAYTTGSSIMPQKKNSDMAELVRGKTGRVYGNLVSLLTALKGLPLAYNKDMQEDKECVFDSLDTLSDCLGIFAPMVKTMTVKADNMRLAAQKGFINATDLADYLVKKGLPFRTAYKTVGKIVAYCIANNTVLEALPMAQYKKFSKLFDDDLYTAIDLDLCVKARVSEGGTSPESVEKQVEYVRAELEKD